MPTEQTQLTIFVLSGLVLLVAIILALYRRRRSAGEFEEDVDPAFAALRSSHEPFYRIMENFQQRHDLAEILADRDVREAYKLLQLKNGSGAARAGSPLQLQSPSRQIDDDRLQAAMLTILRAIYMDRRLVADLDPAAHSQLDRLLDSV